MNGCSGIVLGRCYYIRYSFSHFVHISLCGVGVGGSTQGGSSFSRTEDGVRPLEESVILFMLSTSHIQPTAGLTD